MTLYIVTVKIPKRRDHDPHNKRTEPCPVSGKVCTDATGEHHSYLFDATTGMIEEVIGNARARGYRHVTRIEEVKQEISVSEVIMLRDRIGMCNFLDRNSAHEILQRLTWIMFDPTVINQAISDVTENGWRA